MDRCALITGCSSGIGRATALAFLAEDWDVVATSRAQRMISDLAEAGCFTHRLDVTEQESVDALISAVESEYGRIDCLVNNAGYAQFGPLEDVSLERLENQFAVNVFGAQRVSNAVLPLMRSHDRGTIVTVSSSVTALPLPGTGPYVGSKAAIEAMHTALRSEIAADGIHVVLIKPGTVNTEFATRAREELTPLYRRSTYASVYQLLDDWLAFDGGGPGAVEPDEVADVIVNAASATQPEPTYTVGPIGAAARLAKFVPTGVRDQIVSSILRVTNWREQR